MVRVLLKYFPPINNLNPKRPAVRKSHHILKPSWLRDHRAMTIQSHEALKRNLEEHIEFLRTSAELYDEGKVAKAKYWNQDNFRINY